MSRPVVPHAPATTPSSMSSRPLAGAVLATAVAALLAGCGEQSAARPTATPAATPTPTGVTAAHPGTGPLVGVLDHPFGTVRNTLRLLRPDGVEAASTTLSDTAEAVSMAGRRALIAGDGLIRALDESGTLTDVETLAPSAGTDLLRGIVAAPDGTTWVWSVLHRDDAGVLHSLVYLGAQGADPRLLLDRPNPDHALRPLSWTGAAPVMSDDVVGIGGYIIFRHSFGAAERLDPTTGSLAALTADTCALSDVAADGSASCVVDGREGPHGPGPVTLRIISPSGPVHDLPQPTSVAQAGAALFSPDGHHLTLATSPALGSDGESVATAIIDTATWQTRPVATGLIPTAWLDAATIVAVRDPSVAGGDPGTYLLRLDGTSTRLSAATTVIGLSH